MTLIPPCPDLSGSNRDSFQPFNFNAMDTLSEAMENLNKEGFTEEMRPAGNFIEAIGARKKYNPEDLIIMKSYRFEGMTDPADEMICYAISARDGTKGTLVMSFSAKNSEGVETVRKIPSKK